jgi:pectinesterase
MKTSAHIFSFVFPICVASVVAASDVPQKQFNAVVGANGAESRHSLLEAIDAVPDGNTKPYRILLKPGRYEGQLIVPKNKSNIELLGESAEKTVITYALNQNAASRPGGQPLFNNAGFVVLADDFRAVNIKFENTCGDRGQALAMRVDGDRAVFKHCRLLGWQDTLLLKRGRQYFTDCYIEGRVDFIYGAATTIFDRCEIHSKNGGYVTAANTPQNQPFGFVFLNCKLTGDPKPWSNPQDARTRTKAKSKPLAYLGRPWRPYASVVYLNCEMGDHIKPEGWDNWRNPANEQTARFGEYHSTGPGANVGSRVQWSKQLTKQEADLITIEKVLGGSDHWAPPRTSDNPAVHSYIAPSDGVNKLSITNARVNAG